MRKVYASTACTNTEEPTKSSVRTAPEPKQTGHPPNGNDRPDIDNRERKPTSYKTSRGTRLILSVSLGIASQHFSGNARNVDYY